MSSGSVILVKIWFGLAPSTSAASNRLGEMPSMPAISTIIVWPYHIQKLMNAMISRVYQPFSRKKMAVSAAVPESA